MKKIIFLINASMFMLLFVLQSCRKDDGNYDYKPLPDKVIVNLENADYTQAVGSLLVINPEVAYNGDEKDLSYEWQKWNENREFVTFSTGKNLSFVCGPNQTIPGAGAYTLRLAVSNKKLATDAQNQAANQVYSEVINLTVVNSLYQGLLVLHGDGVSTEVGLIQNNIFLPSAGTSVTPIVTPNFYSSNNQGQKINGVGKQIVKVGAVNSFGNYTYGLSNIYIFTDKTSIETDYQILKNTGKDYKALFADPASVSGKPQFFGRRGETYNALVDDGKIFYGFVVGSLFNKDFSYNAAPQLAVLGVSGFNPAFSSVGVVGFDNNTKAFMYSLFNTNATYIYKVPASTVSGVNFNPANTNANLVYMELRKTQSSLMAIMKDAATGERYLADLNFYQKDLSKIAAGRYSMEALPEINDARYYAFGRELNLSYYATSNKVYQYLYTSGNTANSVFTVATGEQITMMKFAKFEPQSYQFTNQMLLVGTVNGQGRGKIYAFRTNLVTGQITLAGTFTGTENGGTPFGRIYDIDLKTQ